MNAISSMKLKVQSYLHQAQQWPKTGRHILAQFDESSIYVYQAYRPAIAQYALEHQQFGGPFSFSRMSWIKPNFLWMMYRSGWASKEGQEYVLAIRLKRPFFDEILAQAVASTYDPARFDGEASWKHAVGSSDVRLQWDPDHHPRGGCLERRAVQLGLRGKMLERYGRTELLSIHDVTPFVIEQRDLLDGDLQSLLTPTEEIYHPAIPSAIQSVGLDAPPSASIPRGMND
jgi:hypothetical protein